MSDIWEDIMSTVTQGQFDDVGLPKIEIGICRDVHRLPEGQIRASGIIDTGFSGFVQIPGKLAAELHLTLRATTTSMTLADNRIVTRQAGYGIALLGGHPEGGVFYLDETFPHILPGMDFLRIFKRTLLVSARNTVRLVENARLPHILKHL